MAAASLALVLTEHHRAAVRSAGVFYAVITQLGFVAILIALVGSRPRVARATSRGCAARAGTAGRPR